jgi:hypothetical protein
MSTPHPNAKPAGRGKLLLIAFVFAAPILAAALLTVTGWQPTARGNGLPITPQRTLADVVVTLDSGSHYAWRNTVEPQLTLVALPGPGCAARCKDTLLKMHNARITLNRNADRLRLLYLGVRPDTQAPDSDWQAGIDVDGKLNQFRPTEPDTVAAVFVESNATALSYYPSGFDPSGLRKDLQKIIR